MILVSGKLRKIVSNKLFSYATEVVFDISVGSYVFVLKRNSQKKKSYSVMIHRGEPLQHQSEKTLQENPLAIYFFLNSYWLVVCGRKCYFR